MLSPLACAFRSTFGASFAFYSPMGTLPLFQFCQSTLPRPGVMPGRGAALALELRRWGTSTVLGGIGRMLLEEGRFYCVDAANTFDPYAFSRRARAAGIPGDEILDRVLVTRTFTIHQLHAVVAEMLPPLVHGTPADDACGAAAPGCLIGILGLDHLFLEESLGWRERARTLAQVMGMLGQLRQEGARMLVTYEAPAKPASWWRPMLEFGDAAGRVIEGKDGEITIEVRRMRDGQNRSHVQHLPAG